MRTWFTSDTHFGHGRIVGYCDRPWWRPASEEDLDWSSHLRKVARCTAIDESGDERWIVPDVAAMEEALVRGWNERVEPGDDVFHLGDFAWWRLTVEEVARIRARLNGRITLIRGNHDQEEGSKELTAAVHEVFGERVRHADGVSIGGHRVLMYHYGAYSWGESRAAKLKHSRRIEEWGGAREPTLFLHGHSHCRDGVVARREGLRWAASGLAEPVVVPGVDMSVEGWNYRPASIGEILDRLETAQAPSRT